MSSTGPLEPSPGEHSPRWPRLLHHADQPFFVLNARRRLLYANPAWERWAELPFTEVRGQACRKTKSTDNPAALLGLMTPTKEAIAGHPSQVRRRGRNAASPWLDFHFFPWNKGGEVVAILGRIDTVGATTPIKSLPLPEALMQLREARARDHRLELWESDVPAVQRVVAQARLASQTTVPVLLQGPAGSGKEWLARAIHHASPRREAHFASLDAQLLPPALLADMLLQSTTRLNLGAILLRHFDQLQPELQTRLAQMLDQENFGPRLFVSATSDAEASRIVPELLAHLTLTIHVPPLHDRRGDWARLVPTFLTRAGLVSGKPHATLSTEAEQTLRLHNWPGNFRELDRTLRDAALHASGERIELADLPFSLRNAAPPVEPKLPLDDLLQGAERRLIKLALEQSKNNKTKAAQLLGIWRARLLRRMEQLGIADAEPPETESAGGDDA